jgi:hypothetical protein
MQRISLFIGSAAVFFLCGVSSTQACGDKLAAIGGGIRFDQLYHAAHPGHLLVYLSPESRLKMANDDLKIVSWLQRAGHEVKVVDNREALKDALSATKPADLLLVDAAEAGTVTGASTSSGKLAPVLSVLYKPTSAELASATSTGSCVAQASKRRQYQFVQLVDRMVAHGRVGKAGDCAVN